MLASNANTPQKSVICPIPRFHQKSYKLNSLLNHPNRLLHYNLLTSMSTTVKASRVSPPLPPSNQLCTSTFPSSLSSRDRSSSFSRPWIDKMYIGLVGDGNLVCVNRIRRGVLLRGRRILLDGRFCFGARRSRRCIFGRTRSTFFVGVGESVRPGVVFVCVSFEIGWALICCCCCGGGAWSNLFLFIDVSLCFYDCLDFLLSSYILSLLAGVSLFLCCFCGSNGFSMDARNRIG